MKSHLTTQLPQRFPWVHDPISGEAAIRTLDALKHPPVEEAPADIHRMEIEAVALAALRRTGDPDASFRIVRFEQRELLVGSNKFCSGFHILDLTALQEGHGTQASLVTVIYLPDRQQQGREYPLALCHKSREAEGITVRSELDAWSRDQFGMTATQFVERHTPSPQIQPSPPAPSVPPSKTTLLSGGPSVGSGSSVVGDGAAVAVEVVATAADVALSSDSILDGLGAVLEGAGELLSGLADFF